MTIKPLPPQNPLDLSLFSFLITTPAHCPKCAVINTPRELQGTFHMKHPEDEPLLCSFCLTELIPSSAFTIAIPRTVTFLLAALVRQEQLFGIHKIEELEKFHDGSTAGTIALIPLLADEQMRQLWNDYQCINFGDVKTETGKPEYGPIVYSKISWRVNKERASSIPPRKPYDGEVEHVHKAHEAALCVSSGSNHDPNLQLNVEYADMNRIVLKAVYNRPDTDPNQDNMLDPSIGSEEITMEMHWR